jgi:CheY-like chemotaxis protein
MGKRVLVADDSATIQKAFAMVFGGQDLALVPARSLDEALSVARQGRPDLVIADVNLGTRSGYELCAAVKADPGLRGTPVYILSSTHSPYDEARGREAGADGNLLKPFESQGIIDRVNEILARGAVAPAAAAPAPAPPATIAPSVAPRQVEAPPIASAARPSAAPTQPMDDSDDDYGEVTIERAPAPPAALAAPAARAPFAHPAGGTPAPVPNPAFGNPGSPGGLRPSLIPGHRPTPGLGRPVTTAAPAAAPPYGSRPVAPAVGNTPTGNPFANAGQPSPVMVSASGPAPTGPAAIGRTMMGMPAVLIPGVPTESRPRPVAPVTPSQPPASAPPAQGFPAGGFSSPGNAPNAFAPPANAPNAFAPRPAPAAPAQPAPAAPSYPGPGTLPFGSQSLASANAAARIPTPASMAAPLAAPIATPSGGTAAATDNLAARAGAAAAVSNRLDQKISAIAARGPEYEAIAKLSREVIEEIVWEVVPELAEIIIREHVERLERLAAAKK